MDIDAHPDRWISHHFMDKYEYLNTSGEAGERLTDKYAFQISFLVSLKQGLEIPLNILFGLFTVR